MGMRINANAAAQRQLLDPSLRFEKSIESLSSGLRALPLPGRETGFPIDRGLQADIRVLDRMQGEATEGLTLLRTAVDALDEIADLLGRMRNLAQLAANEALDPPDREPLDVEFRSLADEIDRLSAFTSFNGIFLLDGSFGTIELPVGPGGTRANQVSIDLGNSLSAVSLGLGASSLAGADSTNALAALGSAEAASTLVGDVRTIFETAMKDLHDALHHAGTVKQNLTAANTRIDDIDFATRTAAVTSQQIMRQAGISVLTQANITAQIALRLLQGEEG